MNFRKTLKMVAVALAVTLPSAGCSTPRGRGVVVTNCVSDPLTTSLHCVDTMGMDYDVAWKDSGNYVCRPPSDDQKIMEEMHRR